MTRTQHASNIANAILESLRAMGDVDRTEDRIYEEAKIQSLVLVDEIKAGSQDNDLWDTVESILRKVL